MCRTDRSGRTQNRCPQGCEEVHKPRADWIHWEAEGHKDRAHAGMLLYEAADGYLAAQWWGAGHTDLESSLDLEEAAVMVA